MVSSEGHSAALAANFMFHSFSEDGGVGEGGEVLSRTPEGRSRRPGLFNESPVSALRVSMPRQGLEGQPAGLEPRFAARARSSRAGLEGPPPPEQDFEVGFKRARVRGRAGAGSRGTGRGGSGPDRPSSPRPVAPAFSSLGREPPAARAPSPRCRAGAQPAAVESDFAARAAGES